MHWELGNWALLLLLLIGLTGCGRQAHRTGSVLRTPLAAEPASFDPALINDSDSGDLLQHIYEGLVRLGEDNRIEPVLAESWDITNGGRTYTFHLRDAAFHNGRKLTADDVKYSFERALWPETKSSSAASYFAGIVGVQDVASGKSRDLPGIRILDARTLQINLERPRGYFLSALTYYTGLVVCREAIEKNRGRLDEHSAIGAGPFILREFRSHGHALLDANPAYWGGKPPTDRIDMPEVLDSTTRHMMYENGELDIISLAPTDYLRDKDDPRLKDQIHEFPNPAIYYLCLHPKLVKEFADPRVRRAFALAIDKDAVVQVAGHGVWIRADSMLPPGMPGRSPSPPKTPYDPATARRLLAEAGFPGGNGFPQITLVYYVTQPERAVMAQLIRNDLKKNLGITIGLEQREQAQFVSDRRAQKIPFYSGVWTVDYPDPQNVLSTLLRTGAPLNHFGYSSSEVDALLDRADSEPDMAKRAPMYQQADRIAVRESALIPICYPGGRVLVKPYVTGWRHNLLGMLPHSKTQILNH